MATKKDLVEAYSFSKRRLVTAFLSGAPGGREVEPSRPGRTVVGGVALAVLLTAGAAVTGVFKPRTDAGWQDPGLVTSKERATDYVILEPEDGEEPVLRPLINITSAMLLFDSDVEAIRVPEEDLSTLEIGEQIGILDAPGSPPHPDALIQDGWTACTAAGAGVQVTLSTERSTTAAPRAGFLVTDGRRHFLIAEADPDGPVAPRAHVYPVPEGMGHTDVRTLAGSSPQNAVRVPGDWLALFKRGPRLDPAELGLGTIGDPVRYAGDQGIPRDARIGDYYEFGGQGYALGVDGPVAMSPFALALLGTDPRARELEMSDAPSIDLAPEQYSDLPATTAHAPVGDLCAELTPDPERPVVRLAERPGPDASAAEVPKGEIRHRVDSGAGAYVRSGSWEGSADRGSGDDAETVPTAAEEVLIDSRGRSYPLQGSDVAERLGFGDVTAPVAPDAWVELFEEGVTLSVDAARCPPVRDDREAPCE